MNLSKLFEMQAKLDAHIEREHPRKEGEDRLAKKILALQVELGELCNCWRGFKFWSNDQEPRTVKICSLCEGSGGISAYWANYDSDGYVDVMCPMCEDEENDSNPLLEEYIDCLHFILSIGLEIKEIQNKPVENFNYYSFKNPFGITQAFTDLMREFPITVIDDEEGLYVRLFCEFIGLGEMLGFTWDEIEQAYFEKNKVNHERQEEGY